MRDAPQCNAGGFTFLEVILVLLFISIFATVAVLRQPPTDVTLTARAEVLKTHIRYAQSRAMNTDAEWGIRFDASQRMYWLFQRDGQDSRRLLPGEEDTAVTIEQGISISPADFTLSFDTWGRPRSEGTPLSDDLAITLSKDNRDMSIVVTPNTGYLR